MRLSTDPKFKLGYKDDNYRKYKVSVDGVRIHNWIVADTDLGFVLYIDYDYASWSVVHKKKYGIVKINIKAP